MPMVTRRIVLGGLAALPISRAVSASAPENVSVEADEGRITIDRYAADQTGKRAGIIVLHGSRGIDFRRRAYQRYADAINAAGLDVYLVRYFTAVDADALAPGTGTQQRREAYETERFAAWAKRTSAVISAVLARSESSGRVGLLGFSLGGYVAAETAAQDQRVAALAVLYAGMPDALTAKIKHLPPLIELHGDADRNVPLAKGEELVRIAKTLGSPAEQVTYPGKGHGFDFSDSDPAMSDAVGRVTRFFRARLAPD